MMVINSLSSNLNFIHDSLKIYENIEGPARNYHKIARVEK